MEGSTTRKLNICSGCAITYSESKEYSPERVFDFLLKHGVISNTYKCPKCSKDIKLNALKKEFRCYKWNSKYKKKKICCNYRKSVWSKTFFHNSKLPESKVFKLVSAVLWILPPRNSVIHEDVGIKDAQLVDWFLSIREVFIDAVSENSRKLGGKNVIVELAEAKWRSDNLKGGLWDWAFGGIEHHSGETFYCPVEHHSLESLKEIVSKKINPGTTIVTNCTDFLNSQELEDLQKTLDVIFIHPADSTIAEVIKRQWGEVRKGVMNLSSKRPPNSIDQLGEYLFKSKHPVQADRIHAFFVAAGMLYPPGRRNRANYNSFVDFMLLFLNKMPFGYADISEYHSLVHCNINE